jgi:hypothetical protein
VAAPPLLISIISRNPNHYYLGHQYTFIVVAVLMIATVQALTLVREGAAKGAIRLMLTTTLLGQVLFGPSPVSRLFWSPHVYTYHHEAYRLDTRNQAIRAAIEAHIPRDSRFVVSMQNAINSDRLSGRTLALSFPDGLFEPVPAPKDVVDGSSNVYSGNYGQVWADYAVIDRFRPLSIRDEICQYDPTTVCQDFGFRARFDRLVDDMKHEFDVLYQSEGVTIFRRRPRP